MTNPATVGISLSGQLCLEFDRPQALARRAMDDQVIASSNHLLPANGLRLATI